MSDKASKFHVLVTADFYNSDGTCKYRDIGLDVFADQPHMAHGVFDEHKPVIAAEQIGDAAGVIVLTPAVTKQTLAKSENLLAIGRFGVGYDAVDVDACTEADVAAFITAGAVDRSVAEATVTWLLALTHHVRTKDTLVREARWNDRSNFMGSELRDRTLGIVGLGGIGRAVIDLLRGWKMNPPIAFDPVVTKEQAREIGVTLVSLDELMSTADFVSLHCPLNDHTRNLIGKREIGLMKPTSYLINTARGGIVNEDALYEALKAKRIAGAASDVFVDEPVVKPHRFAELDNILLAPHCLAWTNEMFRDIGRAVCQGMVDLSHGKRPHGLLNPAVFERTSFQKKLKRLAVAAK